jgi:hypothetical protein
MAWLGCDAGACDAEMIAPSKRITAPVGVREITPTPNLVHLARSYLAARRGPEVLTLPD